jgi:hypothetical protein
VLLQDRTNILERAELFDDSGEPEDYEIGREVTSGLVNNTRLRSLYLHWLMYRDDVSAFSNGCLHKLLCNSTSIESIHNSNHMLINVADNENAIRTGILGELLDINNNEDKAQVIRDKILKYYFVEDFDVTPFANMPVSVVPEVISHIQSETKQSAIFRLLKCIPELSNVRVDSVIIERGSAV